MDAERPSWATRITGWVRQWSGSITRGREPGRIELHQGDLTDLSPREASDALARCLTEPVSAT